MIILKLGKSKRLLRTVIKDFNAQQTELRHQLRTAHLSLMEKLIYYYNEFLKHEQAYGFGVNPGAPLPPLRTNNAQLAGALGCQNRTVINLRQRLRAAGLIAEEFHGSNSSYAVYFSPQVLHLQLGGEPANLAAHFPPPATPDGLPRVQTLRHTDTGKLINELKEESGVVFPLSPDPERVSVSDVVENVLRPVEKPEKPVENPQRAADLRSENLTGNTTGGTRTAPDATGEHPPVAAPPPEAPETVREVTAHLSRLERIRLERHLQQMWAAAHSQLYAEEWLHEDEIERGRACLAEYLAYSDPRRWKAGAAEVRERILLVRSWIDRRRKEGKRAFVPLPSIYFDVRQENWFRRTKAWFKRHRETKRGFKDQEILTKAINEYMRSLEDNATVGPSETYRRIRQRLNKRNADLLQLFHESIANHGKTTASESAAA